jgi:DNA-binding NarL/FixJ family response regulator
MRSKDAANDKVDNTVSVLIVSKPGSFRSSLATLLGSLDQIDATHFAEDFAAVKDVMRQHNLAIIVLDEGYLDSRLEPMIDGIRTEKFGGIIVVMSDDIGAVGRSQTQAYLPMGIRPERLAAEFQKLLGSREGEAAIRHQDTDSMSSS